MSEVRKAHQLYSNAQMEKVQKKHRTQEAAGLDEKVESLLQKIKAAEQKAKQKKDL